MTHEHYHCPMHDVGSAEPCNRCYRDSQEALDECYRRAADFESILAAAPIALEEFEEAQPPADEMPEQADDGDDGRRLANELLRWTRYLNIALPHNIYDLARRLTGEPT